MVKVDYVVFVDDDDDVTPDYVEQLLHAIEEDADVVVFGLDRYLKMVHMIHPVILVYTMMVMLITRISMSVLEMVYPVYVRLLLIKSNIHMCVLVRITSLQCS